METARTRQTLLKLKARYSTLGDGLEILKTRREALIRELFSIAEECLEKRSTLARLLSEARRRLEVTRAMSEDSLEPYTYISKREVFLEVEKKNVWGVNVAEFAGIELVRSLGARDHSPVGEATAVIDTARDHEKIIDMVVKMASKEVRLERLGEVIRLDTRRVNAIEQVLMPSTQANIKTIARTLEETERESVYRLKRFKARK